MLDQPRIHIVGDRGAKVIGLMPPAARNKQNVVYERLRARLGDGIYPAGHRLNVAQFAREFGLSTIPVREALRRLEAEGWLEYSRNSGMRVAARDIETWIELSIPFAVLAGFATAEAGEALRAGNGKGLDALRALNVEFVEALDAGEYATASAANTAFHQRIFDSTPHPGLRRQLTETWQQLNVMRRELFGAIPMRASEAAGEHDELIELLASGADGFEIEAAARAHTLRTVMASRVSAAEDATAVSPAGARD